MEIENSQKRSLIKTVTWRILATVTTGIVVYFYTGEIVQSGKITLTVAIILTLFYYLHERFWSWIKKKKLFFNS